MPEHATSDPGETSWGSHNTVTVVDFHAPFTLFAVSNRIHTCVSELAETRIKGSG